MLEIMLSSGMQLDISHVELFDELIVTEIATLNAQAAAKLGRTSSGIGFVGSPEWVIGGTIVASVLAKAASNQAAKEATEMLLQAQAQAAELRSIGRFFPVESMNCSDPSNPQSWFAVAEEPIARTYDTTGWEGWRKRALIEKYAVPASQGQVRFTVSVEGARFVHDGGGFVRARASERTLGIRWSEVVSYCLVKPESQT